MINYRKAVKEDLQVLTDLRITFMKEIRKITGPFDDSTIRRELIEYFGRTLSDKSFIAWLAEEDGQIIGTSGLCFYQLPPSMKNPSGRTAYIMNMYTVPGYRKKGIAAELFQKVMEEAKGMGYKKITLHATEMGRPLYEKFGFKQSADEMILNLPG